MSAQLSKQQLEHASKVWDEKVKAKTLECASLQAMLGGPARDFIARVYLDEKEAQPFQDAVHNFLTAIFNQAVIELQELELQLKGLRMQASGIVGAAGVILPPNHTH